METSNTWKSNVERIYRDHRVVVAEYRYPTMRRKDDNLIDTFAIVHPRDESEATECSFINTAAVYPFPVRGHTGGLQSLLRDDPSLKYNYIQYGDKDIEELKQAMTDEKNKL